MITRKALLDTLRQKIRSVQKTVFKERQKVDAFETKTVSQVRSMNPEDQDVYLQVEGYHQERLSGLTHLESSPFFAKCVLERSSDGVHEYYFGKHALPDENIYSWVAPIAATRFEEPGAISYTLPDGRIMPVRLLSKNQYMIVDGKVVFYATEGIGEPRTLVHQEHFSNKKSNFILPEIVAVMEKAQDKVIRADYKGAFAIRGPAGSGKTTLALHRVAYLAQSPETIDLYTGNKILVVVQDIGTKEYFSNLLPELGITSVNIRTFSEWAFEILDQKDWVYTPHYSSDSTYAYEYEKIKAFRLKEVPRYGEDAVALLKRAYRSLSVESKKILERQMEDKVLDRIDVTLLLMSYRKTNKILVTKRKTLVLQDDGEFKTALKKRPVSYALVVVDEFQNYLPEQLTLLKSCVDKELQSVMYIGDMAQRVRLGTIRGWDEIDEEVSDDRDVVLHKVYRNTKQILDYIQQLGYSIEIPPGIKSGSAVTEITIDRAGDMAEYLEKIIKNPEKGIVGIICVDKEKVSELKEKYRVYTNTHVVSMEEVQGVEFDTVCIVGIRKDMFVVPRYDVFPEELKQDIKKIQKDLLYISLTRAISEMHVIGSCLLKDAVLDFMPPLGIEPRSTP